MMKRIVLCADDYGQAKPISEGILELIDMGRLSATSCLVNQADWRDQANQLRTVVNKVDIGLHLNFTEGEPLSPLYREQIGQRFMPLWALLLRTNLRDPRLKQAALEAEIEMQLDSFQLGVGIFPDFIDGHQHVHHLPLIREALFAVYQRRLRDKPVYLRAVTGAEGIKGKIIHFTGGAAFLNHLKALHIPANATFAGVYNFQDVQQYRQYFQQFLSRVADKGLIMCHPGHIAYGDPIAHAREAEWQYFRSNYFIEDCKASGVILSRFNCKNNVL